MSLTSNIFMYILIACMLFIAIGICISYYRLQKRYNKVLSKYYEYKQRYLHRANQMSMVEYHYRNYKEGVNAFTVLRNIGQVVYNDYKEVD